MLEVTKNAPQMATKNLGQAFKNFGYLQNKVEVGYDSSTEHRAVPCNRWLAMAFHANVDSGTLGLDC